MYIRERCRNGFFVFFFSRRENFFVIDSDNDFGGILMTHHSPYSVIDDVTTSMDCVNSLKHTQNILKIIF